MSTTTAEPVSAGAPERQPAAEALLYARKALKVLSSLQLTVALFAFSILLVFFGTMAQRDSGIWTVVDKYFWSWYVMVPFDLIHQFAQVFFAEQFPKTASPWSGSFPLPAGKLLGGAMLANLLSAHALRFKLTWKRAGIFLIHSGMILLFVGEFITREFAVEQRMTIPEGSAINYAEDVRNVELAIVDKSDPKDDRVTVIPGNLLKQEKGRIANPDLPFDLEVLDYMVNSKPTAPTTENRATTGIGLREMAIRQPEVSGVDPNQAVDSPAAYVKLFKKGTNESVGTYLVSLLNYRRHRHDAVTVDGKAYDVALRFKRYYKDFSIYLVDFKFDRYPGTQKPKNYSSEVKVLDRNGEVARELTIRMNDPLRHEGETFYQSSFENEGTAVESTVLQVVKNPGWVIPYVSCVMVGLGLIVHFLIGLVGFLTKRSKVAATLDAGSVSSELVSEARPVWWVRNLPWVALAVVSIYLLSVYGRMAPEKKPYNLDAFARIPVLEGGRVKPLDSVARVYLRIISGQSVLKDDNGDEHPAIEWYLDTLGAKPSDESNPAWSHKIIRIDNEQVLADLKLTPREGLRYSIKEIQPKLHELEAKVKQAEVKQHAGKQLDLTETKVIDVAKKISLVMHVAQGRGHDTDKNKFHLVPPQHESEKWMSYGEYREDAVESSFNQFLSRVRETVRLRPGGFRLDDARRVLGKAGADMQEKDLANVMQTLFELDAETLRIRIAPEAPGEILNVLLKELSQADQDELRAQSAADLKARLAGNAGVAMWDRMIDAHRQKKSDDFNALVDEYRTGFLGQVAPDEVQRAGVEINYNRFAPFLRCIGLYVIALVLAVLGFVLKAAELPRLGDSFRRSATLVLALTLVIHVVGLITRMYVSDRWFVFVTNLYSSAIFIGLGCVALGLILEVIYPIGIGNAVAAVLGVSTTIVAHNLATEDTLEMMEAVLDTNFWLATHVTTVTLGYTATFVAGFLGVAYVLLMLAAVVRDSFASTVQPAADALLSFGAAIAGIVTIPVLICLVIFETLKGFELVHSSIGTILEFALVAGAVLYGLAHLMARASNTQGTPTAGEAPKFARPIVGMGLTPALSKILGQMIYGVVCFATMLSFIGTVLGGIWADQSWGRFWGWDPKENGAVLIVLWNALILHARWCGLVKERGMAMLVIFGNVITAWSWFGTNQLEFGLHSYGRNPHLADGCANFWMAMALVMLLGLIPRSYWASATRSQPKAAPTLAANAGKKSGRKKS